MSSVDGQKELEKRYINKYSLQNAMHHLKRCSFVGYSSLSLFSVFEFSPHTFAPMFPTVTGTLSKQLKNSFFQD